MAATEEVIIDVSIKGAKQAEKEIDGLTDSLEEQATATDKADKETKQYNKTLGDTIKETRIFGVSLNSLSQGFSNTVGSLKNSVRGLKAFKVALAATGIGLIIIALGSLVALFSESQKGLDLMTKAFDAFKAVMDVVINRFVAFGEGLVKFFSGDFAEGIEDMGAAFKGMGAEIITVVNASTELSDAQAELERQQIAFITREAELKKIRKEENQDAEDITKTLQERVKASKAAEEAETERATEAIRLAEEELRILVARQAQGQTTRDDLRERAQLEAELFRIQEESAEFLTTQGNKTRLLQKQIVDENIIAHQAEQAELNRITAEGEFARLGTLNDTTAALALIQKQQVDNTQKKADLELAIEQEKNKQIAAASADLFGELAGLAGQNTAFGKAAAIAEATINTWLGVTTVLGSTAPWFLKPILIATNIAAGLNAIKNITAVPIPKVDVQETSFADGGFVGGRPHSQGGTIIEAEKGEYIISKNRMAIPGVRRAAMSLNNYKQSGRGRYALGGEVLSGTDAMSTALNRIEQTLRRPQIVLPIEDLNAVENKVRVIEGRASI